MTDKKKPSSILDRFRSRRLTPYLALFALIGIFLSVPLPLHDNLRSSLVIELTGALILLLSFDRLETWRIERAQKHEATYRLYVVYQLLYIHAKKYLEGINEITSENFLDRPTRDLLNIKFTDLIYFFNPSYYYDSTSASLVYHLSFESLFKVIDEMHQAIYSLNPAYHFEIMEIYREFIQQNESVYRLYEYFKSLEGKPGAMEHFYNEMVMWKNGKGSHDVNALAKNASDLNAFAKLYLLTLSNINLRVKQAELVQGQLKDFHDVKAGDLKFEFD